MVTLSLVSCSISPRTRNTKCRVLSFWILSSTYALVVRLYSMIVNFICSQIIAHFIHRENGSFEVLSLHHPVGYSRPPSAVNDPTVTKQIKFVKVIFEDSCHILQEHSRLAHLLPDFLNYKKTTRNLANSTM